MPIPILKKRIIYSLEAASSDTDSSLSFSVGTESMLKAIDFLLYTCDGTTDGTSSIYKHKLKSDRRWLGERIETWTVGVEKNLRLVDEQLIKRRSQQVEASVHYRGIYESTGIYGTALDRAYVTRDKRWVLC